MAAPTGRNGKSHRSTALKLRLFQGDAQRAISLIGEPRDVHIARGFVLNVLTARGNGKGGEDVVVVASELVTNAIVHGRPPITLSLVVQPASVVVSVSDTGTAIPKRAVADVNDESGRGLTVVDLLSRVVGRARGRHQNRLRTSSATPPDRWLGPGDRDHPRRRRARRLWPPAESAHPHGTHRYRRVPSRVLMPLQC